MLMIFLNGRLLLKNWSRVKISIILLQVSNWNEHRKTKTTVKAYLSELKKEMKDNLELLKVRMAQNQANVEAAQQLLQLLSLIHI